MVVIKFHDMIASIQHDRWSSEDAEFKTACEHFSYLDPYEAGYIPDRDMARAMEVVHAIGAKIVHKDPVPIHPKVIY